MKDMLNIFRYDLENKIINNQKISSNNYNYIVSKIMSSQQIVICNDIRISVYKQRYKK